MKHGIMCLVLLGTFFFSGCVRTGTAQVEADLENRVRELLKAEPELILDVFRNHPVQFIEVLEQALLAKREHDRLEQEQADLAVRHSPLISADRPVRGNPDAPVTIVEYSDFLCPYCSSAAATIEDLMDRQEGEVRLVFKHLPLNPVSLELALAFEALALQDHAAAWKFHDAVFSRQGEARSDYETLIAQIVRETGVNPERFAADRRSPEVAALLEKDREEARRFGFNGTPMFMVNGIAVRGAVPLREFERVVELAKNEAPATR